MTSSKQSTLIKSNLVSQNSEDRLKALTTSEINIHDLVKNVPQISDLLQGAHHVLDLDPTRAGLMIRQATDLLIGTGEAAELLEVAKPRLIKGGLAPWQYRNVDIFVAVNLNRQIRLEDLAAVTKLSISHFSRAFKNSYGESPYTHIMRKRIATSQILMLATEEPLCQIAALCGLADQAHLSNLFRRYVGITPYAWRRMSRPAVSVGWR